MIELRHVTKRYGAKEALRDVSLTAPDGCVLGLLGVNGAGKTTALNLMTGYFPPDGGQVLVDGRDMQEDPRGCKRAIGYLPEVPPLYDEMTVREYLAFVARLREVKARGIPAHIRDIAGLCGLEEVFHRPLGKLSKGFRQRVGFASALCGDPPTLIFDEPTVGLDPRQVVEIRELIRTLGKTHSVIFSSHMLSEVQQLCSQVVILHRGRVVKQAALGELSGGGELLLRLEAAGPAARLVPALKGLPCVRRLRVTQGSRPDLTGCVLTCDATPDPARGDAQTQIFRLLCALDMPLRLLAPEGDSLEEVFLRLTRGEEEGETP